MTDSLPLPGAVFKAYDIRGTVPEQLNPVFAHLLGLALAERARAEGIAALVVGYDGRHSSPELSMALQKGLMQGGIDTIDIGMVPTPMVYFATHTQKTGSGVAITGSHNPPQYNGFKMMMGGKTLHGDDIQALKQVMTSLAPDAAHATPGSRRTLDLLDTLATHRSRCETCPSHENRHRRRQWRRRPDGNAACSRRWAARSRSFSAMWTATFPNHHPDPADPHNLQDLIRHVKETDCELGLAFDGDGDRLGVVTKSGEIIWPDRQLILYALDILQRQPGRHHYFRRQMQPPCSRGREAGRRQALDVARPGIP